MKQENIVTTNPVETVTHRNLGLVEIDENCHALQAMNPDSTSMFIKHDGEIKEVTSALVSTSRTASTTIVNSNGINAMQWQSIESAPKDGTVILVEDTNESTAPWAAAKWLSGKEWSGWVYDDEILQDGLPLGPCPTLWLDVPQLPK